MAEEISAPPAALPPRQETGAPEVVRPAQKRTPPPPLSPGQFAGIDRRTAERFRSGKMPMATLDLHGMQREAAYEALCSFIERHYHGGRRALLVITGKGRRGEGAGVLRESLPHWLNLPPLRDWLLAVSGAPQARGGEGAFMLLLKRKRGEHDDR